MRIGVLFLLCLLIAFHGLELEQISEMKSHSLDGYISKRKV